MADQSFLPSTDSEAVFVQKLTSGEPPVRARALKKLHAYVKVNSKKNQFSEPSLARLCQGLHYALWMQDKQLLQEQLSEDIASLMDDFQSDDEVCRFMKTFFLELSKRWHSIDRWRMDKFLFMVRIVIRKILLWASSSGWNADRFSLVLKLFDEVFINSDVVLSLRAHFASLYWDEINNAENVTEAIASKFAQLYIDALRENRLPDLVFTSVRDEIFNRLVHTESGLIRKKQIAKRIINNGNESEVDEEEEYDPAAILQLSRSVPLDYADISKQLLDIGGLEHINARRRQTLYGLSKKFATIVRNKDPFPKPEKLPAKYTKLPKSLVINAADKISSFDAKIAKDRLKHRERMKAIKKQQRAESVAQVLANLAAIRAVSKPKKSANKFKPNSSKKKGHGKSSHGGVMKGKIGKKNVLKQ